MGTKQNDLLRQRRNEIWDKHLDGDKTNKDLTDTVQSLDALVLQQFEQNDNLTDVVKRMMVGFKMIKVLSAMEQYDKSSLLLLVFRETMEVIRMAQKELKDVEW